MSNLTLSEAAIAYLEALQKSGKHERTLYTYGKDLEQIQAFFGPDKPVTAITLPFMGRFLKSDELLKLSNGKNRATQTVNKTIRVFRMFMHWLAAEGYISEFNLPKSIPLGHSNK